MSPIQQVDKTAWSTRKLLAWTTDHLAKKGVDHPRLSAEMMLSHVLGVERLRLYMDPDRPATELERAAFRELVERAASHEPVDYLVGCAPFFSMMLKVNPHVLIPRPSTEAVVDHIIHHAKRTPGFNSPLIADVGTGCGTIAIALAKHVPNSRVIATDISTDVLGIARENAVAHGVADRIELLHGDLLEPLGGRRVHYLVSNPPYISDAMWAGVATNIKDYEPVTALRGGTDGLKVLRPLIEHASTVLLHPSQLVLEIDSPQKQAVLNLVTQSAGLANGHILPDHEGLARVLVADGV